VSKVISYLQAESISKSIGELVLFEDISININKDQKIALIAKNGAGKTSILNILAGLDSPDKGVLSLKNDLSIAYLSQDPVFNHSNSVLNEIYSSSNEIVLAIKAYEQAIPNNDQVQLEEANAKMDALNAWDYEVKIKQILTRLNIVDFEQKVGTLSGGQKKRLALASALITEPDLLIMDEPTNHLDLDMIEWLEQFLKQSKCTLFMVTHDRYFLDRICNEIVELDDKSIHNYRGNYAYFLEKRDLRLSNLSANIDKAKNLLRKELDWMRRMPQARGTKSKSRVDSFYELKDTANQKIKDEKVSLNVKISRLGKKILELHYISKGFDKTELIKDFHYKFVRGEKIGIVGKNGCGKTTLLNLITQAIKPDKGKIEIGETVKYGYYEQSGIQFKDNQRVIEVVRDIAEEVTLGDGKKMSVSQFLNYFLFPPETHFYHISKLSGGEKRRLYLLTVLMQNPNFLILDEPTNDLDIMTLNVLEEYLQQFAGCVLIVSHDRYFMDKVVDHLFVFEGEQIIRDFPGNYSQYRELQIAREKEEKRIAALKPNTEIKKEKPKSSLKISYKDKREFELLEKEIEQLTNEKEELEGLINSGSLPQYDLFAKSNRLGEILDNLDALETRWLELDELINN
jgi:ABC transport system ATP-binding/permease protein